MTGLIVAAVAFVLFVVWLIQGLRHANKVIAGTPDVIDGNVTVLDTYKAGSNVRRIHKAARHG